MNMVSKKVTFLIILIVAAGVGFKFWQDASKDTAYNKIGAALFLTGNQAFLGKEVQKGMELARAHLTETGQDLELFYEDSKDIPRDAIAALTRLSSINNTKVIISTGDVVSLSLIPVAERQEIVLFSTLASTADLPSRSKWSFRYSTSTATNAEVMINYAANETKAKRVAALYINNDFGKAWLEEAKTRLSAQGLELVGSQAYAIDAQNLRTQIASLIDKKPDALLLAGFGPAYAVAIIQSRELAPDLPIIADATFSVPFFQQQAGSAGEQVAYASTIFDASNPSSPEMEKFVKAYNEKYETPVGFISAFGYDITMLIAKAFRDVSSDQNITSEELRTKLIKIKNFPGVMGNLSIEDNGDVEFPLFMKKVINGKHVRVGSEN